MGCTYFTNSTRTNPNAISTIDASFAASRILRDLKPGPVLTRYARHNRQHAVVSVKARATALNVIKRLGL